ncbi:MAG: hypothetical protein C0511_16305 [Hyphomicrobium sp.]|nr:hypothetical protein [Hyphomicrobium sp.]
MFDRISILAITAALGIALFTPTASEAASCRARLSATGSGQGILGVGTQNARAAATSNFESKAKSRHGSKFASLSKASDVKWDCRSTALKATCVVTAKPCR